MSVPLANTNSPAPSLLRSIGAVLLGFFTIVVLSLLADQVLHMLGIYPPWGQPMRETSDNLLALSYRIVIGVLGSYLAASSRRSGRCCTRSCSGQSARS